MSTVLLFRTAAAESPAAAPPSTRALEVLRRVQDDVPGLRELKVDERLGIVTLSGIAGDLPSRREALASARGVPGVLEVLDLLVVLPRPRKDEDIEREILARLELLGPRVAGVTARVAGGIVELSGAVESLALRAEVDDRAAEVPGVRDVANTLAVDPWAELPSQRIPEDIAWALPFDSTTVTMVRQGETVILRGVLLNGEQVDRLVQAMMRQPGVARVVSELEVKNPFEKLPGFAGPR